MLVKTFAWLTNLTDIWPKMKWIELTSYHPFVVYSEKNEYIILKIFPKGWYDSTLLAINSNYNKLLFDGRNFDTTKTLSDWTIEITNNNGKNKFIYDGLWEKLIRSYSQSWNRTTTWRKSNWGWGWKWWG